MKNTPCYYKHGIREGKGNEEKENAIKIPKSTRSI